MLRAAGRLVRSVPSISSGLRIALRGKKEILVRQNARIDLNIFSFPNYCFIQVRAFSSSAIEPLSNSLAPLFDKILIANRGEIACRIIRTARRLGIKTVAVYSDADRLAQHVQLADEAVYIGGAPAAESYLRVDQIIKAAKDTGAQAIHPGYGFLSENAAFSEALKQAGLVFIGPPASAIRSMGSKSESKHIMTRAGVPCVPGYHGDNQDDKYLSQQADKIGYPVLIKAIAGGGGKGMRIVHRAEEFQDMLQSSRRESKKSFGDDTVLVEKYLTRPRHVEVQVFADQHGQAVYLHERDCSVQRRHQKILEEAPAPNLSQELRQQFGRYAVEAAKAVGYVGAGTVEFILDADTNQFYFMEMNTRLQVEHPVTEMITKQDLVEWQFMVAAGRPLPLKQEEIPCDGHAFEARIYAENPDNQFLPDTGPLLHVRTPSIDDNTRIDTGVQQGDQVTVYYDPMIAKLIVHGRDRTEALRRLRVALEQYEIVGLKTNIDFLTRLARHPAFINMDLDTGFIKRHEKDLFPEIETLPPLIAVQAAAALVLADFKVDQGNVWYPFHGKYLTGPLKRKIEFLFESKPITVEVEYLGENGAPLTCTFTVQNERFERVVVEGDLPRVVLQLPHQRTSLNVVILDKEFHVFSEQLGQFTLQLAPADYVLKQEAASASSGHAAMQSPMPSKVVQVLVKPGDVVKRGQSLIILEAMKMEHVVRAAFDGTVEKIHCSAGQLVKERQELLVVTESS